MTKIQKKPHIHLRLLHLFRLLLLLLLLRVLLLLLLLLLFRVCLIVLLLSSSSMIILTLNKIKKKSTDIHKNATHTRLNTLAGCIQ